jgi:hypothetical protein
MDAASNLPPPTPRKSVLVSYHLCPFSSSAVTAGLTALFKHSSFHPQSGSTLSSGGGNFLSQNWHNFLNQHKLL